MDPEFILEVRKLIFYPWADFLHELIELLVIIFDIQVNNFDDSKRIKKFIKYVKQEKENTQQIPSELLIMFVRPITYVKNYVNIIRHTGPSIECAKLTPIVNPHIIQYSSNI